MTNLLLYHPTKPLVVATGTKLLIQPSCFFAKKSDFWAAGLKICDLLFDDFMGAIYSTPKLNNT